MMIVIVLVLVAVASYFLLPLLRNPHPRPRILAQGEFLKLKTMIIVDMSGELFLLSHRRNNINITYHYRDKDI